MDAAGAVSDWDDFAQRCADNVRKIHETGDEGVYAKLYAADVARLLAMLSIGDEEMVSSHTAFEWTKSQRRPNV